MRRSIPPSHPSPRPPPAARNVIAPLKHVQIIKPALPLEIISTILDHLPIPALMRCARVSRRLQEMVYDDTRWIQKLVAMGVWDESEARRRVEDLMKRKKALKEAKALLAGANVVGGGGVGQARGKGAEFVFDVREEERRKAEARRLVEEDERLRAEVLAKRRGQGLLTLEDELDMLNLGGAEYDLSPRTLRDPVFALSVLDKEGIRSVRGLARFEYGRIYGALAHFYFDIAKSRSHADPVLFRIYRDPKLQAKMLSQLRTFSESDDSYGWLERKQRLESLMGIFENAALKEFEGGYEAGEVEGRMKRYAEVLITLNGGQACVQLFVQKHPVLFDKEAVGNPMDAFKGDTFTLAPAREFLTRIQKVIDDQAVIIEKVFPPTTSVYFPLLETITDDVISEYITPLLDEARERNVEQYLEAMGSLWMNIEQFAGSLRTVNCGNEEEEKMFRDEVGKVIRRVFETHVDLYLQDELEHFKRKCEMEVNAWEKKITDEDTATESFFMSSVNRETDKRDFLSTFKKAILMPVNAIPLPTLASITSLGATKTPSATSTTPSRMNETTSYFGAAQPGSNSLTIPADDAPSTTPAITTPTPVPTTELAAKTAIMNSRLEGIKSLFSLEVALNLVHEAKASLERAALFTALGGQTGEEAREQCEQIFISLVNILGARHVKMGFDKAVQHLSAYNPRESAAAAGAGMAGSTPLPGEGVGVAPLVMFLELVNVGDLIQQMLDVFYEQELVAKRLTDRTDFLNASTNEKRKFEQMLDERVAAGLNRGIDVLIDEVDYIFATVQKPEDFNPGVGTIPTPSAFSSTFSTASSPAVGLDLPPPSPMPANIGSPTETARRIVSLVESHTRLLQGSTDKHLLDVFNTELGMRLFTSLQKHIKRQRISISGAPALISDISHYHSLVTRMRSPALVPYFNALREVAQIYLIDARDAKAVAGLIADGGRWRGVWRTEEVLEFAARREDWFRVRKEVEKAMYGQCLVM